VDPGKRLDAPVDARVVVLADEARNGRLAVCAGAGVSRPSGIPTGPELASMLHERFEHVSGYQCAHPDTLLEVADAVSRLPDGLAAVQRTALALGPFDTAPAQLAHTLLALLVAEDALRLLLTNWDDCVERSWRPLENIQAARNAVEAESLRGQFILKIHGCCTQPDTLLITSQQLTEPGLWTKTHFQAQLAMSTMVFVGIGDIAEYAQKRIEELAGLVEHARVRVVSPSITREWQTSAWRELLPTLPDERRIAETADEFLDQLAREWVMYLVQTVRNAPTTMPAPWLAAVSSAFQCLTALQALRWLRTAAVGWRVGESVVGAPSAASALEAIGLLARNTNAPGPANLEAIRFVFDAAILVGESRVEVLLYKDRQTISDIEEAAIDRARRVGRLYVRDRPVDLKMLCAASSVRGPKPRRLNNVDITDPQMPLDDVIAAGAMVDIELVFADEVLAAA
jgi:hypothetical protein